MDPIIWVALRMVMDQTQKESEVKLNCAFVGVVRSICESIPGEYDEYYEFILVIERCLRLRPVRVKKCEKTSNKVN